MNLIIISLVALFNANGPSEDVLKKIHKRYEGKWHKTLTFVQTTERYRNDTLRSTTTWNEALQFPYTLRIDLGDKKLGNSVIYAKDSTYNFRNGKKMRTTTDKNDLIFLVGGMHFESFDKVTATLKLMGYDLNKFHESTWKGKAVYVIGAAADGDKSNQLWIEKDRLILLRVVKYGSPRKEEYIFENHIKLGTSWIETKASFYFDDKLAQVEKYNNVKANPVLDPAIFDPAMYGKVSWY